MRFADTFLAPGLSSATGYSVDKRLASESPNSAAADDNKYEINFDMDMPKKDYGLTKIVRT